MWPNKKVTVELLDANRNIERRVKIEAKDAGAFRVRVEGRWYERVGQNADGVDRYVHVK